MSSHPWFPLRLAAGLLLLAGPLCAQPWDEYALVRAMPTYALSRNTGGVPNALGLVGSNQNTTNFSADNQRGATDSLVAGVALRGRGEIADSTCDTYVSNGLFAIETAFALQTPAGDFSSRSDTITNPGNGAAQAHFFLAWSARALWLMMQNPDYAALHGSRVQALLPKFEKAMDHFTANGSGVFNTTSQLNVDFHSANRSIINAAAFACGRRLLTGYSSQAKLDSYRARCREWLDNVLIIPNPYLNGVTGSPLLRLLDAVYLERPPGKPAGQDTSYQGVANRFLLYVMLADPELAPEAVPLADRAGRWFVRRFLPDPSNPALCHIDTTHSTRSGLGNEEGATKTHDRNSGLQALLTHAAMFSYPEGNVAADRLARLSSVPAAERTNLPPAVFGSPMAGISPGIPFTFTVLASNSGFTADASFAIDIQNLPPWLSADSLQINKSTGWRILTGTPPPDLPSTPIVLTITPASSNGTGTATTLLLEPQPARMFDSAADAFVRGGTSQADVNYGTDPTLVVKASNSADTNRKSLLRFATATLPGTPISARLRIYGSFGSDSSSTLTVKCLAIEPPASWTESTVTWNTLPVSPGPLLTFTQVGRPDQYWEWDVSSHVLSRHASGDGDLAFLLEAAVNSTGEVNLSSREASSFQPTLVIAYQPGGGLASATTDSDADGLSDLMEHALGADPTVPDAAAYAPQMILEGMRSGLSFRRRSDPSLRYRVQASQDLSLWTNLWSSDSEPLPDALFQAMEIREPLPADPLRPANFLRLIVEPAN